jgi:hypothetical protein
VTALNRCQTTSKRLKAALIVARAEAAAARARQSGDQALIAHLKLQIENSTASAMGRARSVPRGYWISSN